MQSLHTRPITLEGENSDNKRQEIRNYFHKTFDLFERGFEVLKDDSIFHLKSEPTRHPMIFYFGHTASFFVNKLLLSGAIDKRINPHFESLFAIGVDEMSWDDMDGQNYQWPAAQEVREYRSQVRALIDALITTLPLTLPIKAEDPFWIILMGIEHERIHIETSSVLHRQLPVECVKPHASFPLCSNAGPAPSNALINIKGGKQYLGKNHGHHLYGWDNEYGSEQHIVDDFKAGQFLVSNGEFMAFVSDGGYSKPQYWDEEGLAFLQERDAAHPVFWVKETDGSFSYRSLTHIIPMPMNWPVDVNYLEAKAFCRWKTQAEGKPFRLPTEAEWYQLYERANLQDAPNVDDENANINLRHYASSCPVNEFSFGDMYDVIGNAWQWTETPTNGFDGFNVHPVYDDFSTPTFDGKHNLMKGGSWISTGNEIMKHSRYAFRRHFYQHAGFRYIQAENMSSNDANIYETDALISQYCEFQYGDEHFGVKNFAVACADLVKKYSKNLSGKALDLGCATGRATFELAQYFDHVTGIDFSARFIQVGVELQKNGAIRYQRMEEGSLHTIQERTLTELGLEKTTQKVEFLQGDACNLKPRFTGYDVIMATNLIDRLYEPRLFLDHIHERINNNGLLVLTSPYTWLEEYTQKQHWLGGYSDENGNAVTTLEGLQSTLHNHFELVHTQNVEFVIRETPRKYQHSISQMTIWRKK